MNWQDDFNKVIYYIEEHLEEETDHGAMASMLGYSVYHFQRLFLMLAGATVAEYIRNRRLAKAAVDLQNGAKALDVAVKYQYSTAASFNRAFQSMHGALPSQVQKGGATVKAYPPLAYNSLPVKGAGAMDYRIVRMDGFRIVGKKLSTTMEHGACYTAIPAFWGALMESGGPEEVLALMDSQPLGLLGVSDYNPDLDSSRFDYYIAAASAKPLPPGMQALTVPAATWSVFPHRNEGPDAIQKFQQRILLEWLPSSGYEFANAPDMEVYDDAGGIETWVPIVKKPLGIV